MTSFASRGLGLSAVLVAAACGGVAEPIVEGELAPPSSRDARVTVTPALDLSGLLDVETASQLAVEQVVIHLADARLLGDDPRIPAGGLPLMDAPELVYSEGDGLFGIELPFPSEFLGDTDLAVYLRTEPTDQLDGAAVRVVAVVPEGAGAFALGGEMVDPEGDPVREGGMVDPEGDPVREGEDGDMVDPEGDPVREGEDGDMVDPEGDPVLPGMVDPEGDPVHPGMVDPEGDPVRPGGMVDPEGDPVRCVGPCGQAQQELKAGTRIVLLDRNPTELVVSFERRSHFNVVFGIRAATWLNAVEVDDGPLQAEDEPNPNDRRRRRQSFDENLQAMVIEADSRDGEEGSAAGSGEGYFLGDGLPTEGGLLGELGGF